MSCPPSVRTATDNTRDSFWASRLCHIIGEGFACCKCAYIYGEACTMNIRAAPRSKRKLNDPIPEIPGKMIGLDDSSGAVVARISVLLERRRLRRCYNPKIGVFYETASLYSDARAFLAGELFLGAIG